MAKKGFLYALGAAMWLALFALLSYSSIVTAGQNGTKVIVYNDSAALQSLTQSNAQLITDYGTYSVWRVPSDAVKIFANQSGITPRPDFDQIGLRGSFIDTTNFTDAKIPAQLRQTRQDAAQMWLVQFAAPVQVVWLNELTAKGLEIVAYMPQNAYIVYGTNAQLTALENVTRQSVIYNWTGAYHPAYRLDPNLHNIKQSNISVTVQIYNTPKVNDTLSRLQDIGGKIYRQPLTVQKFSYISLELPSTRLPEIAGWSDVFNVEPYFSPMPQDERQAQIVAGNVSTSGGVVVPQSPGYLDWLSAKGFSGDPAQYPLVDVVDDGLDDGTVAPLDAEFYDLGDKTRPARLLHNQNCTAAPKANGVLGHGHLNASILGGYNDRTGVPYQDADGYRYGLGIAPFVRFGGTKIFNDQNIFDVSGCGGNESGIILKSYAAGAQITSNSWSETASGQYRVGAQIYDALTRDANNNATDGNQPLLHIFAAGNYGTSGVGTPGTAKNVLTVGATENVRDDGILDGCLQRFANNADDILTNSARGPVADGRAKPDIVAPGRHIQGAASKDPAYNGNGVCGGFTNKFAPGSRDPNHKFYPNPSQNGITQTLYTWSSGTSHATPAVAGAAALLYNRYEQIWRSGAKPSPALLKALILNSARYLEGEGTGGTLPGGGQGWGGVELQTILSGAPIYIHDQERLLSQSGQIFTRTGVIANSGQPLRLSLVWTDAPGATTGNAYVNDLNLELAIGGQIYRGNVFQGASSVPGGTADFRNNVENIFLPSGLSGSFVFTVTAFNLAGDGVPGNQTPLDQDFGLVCFNCTVDLQPVSGNLQAAAPGTNFERPLVARLLNDNRPVAGSVLTFTAPAEGASAVFANGSHTFSGATDSSGYITTTILTANNIAGIYDVLATSGMITVPFTLVNCDPRQVFLTTDDGSGRLCGTLSYALSQTPPYTVTFALRSGNIVNLTGAPVLTVSSGIVLDGGECGTRPPLLIKGNVASGDGLRLGGGVTLRNLTVRNFGGRQIVATGGRNVLQCVRVER
jgi:hypothetical protein